MPDYEIFRLAAKRGGGLAAYLHKTLRVDANIYGDLNLSEQDIELLVLNVSQKCTKPLTISLDF